MKAKQFCRKLQQAGVELTKSRGKGGHYLATCGDKWTTVPVHGDTDLSPEFMERICKQLGLDPQCILRS